MKNLLIIAKQRSGTTGLTAALSSDGRLKELGEIFHLHYRLGDTDNFFNYLESLSIDNLSKELFCRKNLFKRYLSNTINRHKNQHLIIDVKYNSLRNADQSFMHLYGIPDILLEWTNNNWPIVWLTRKNKLKGIVSHEFAMNTDHWHSFIETDSRNSSDFKKNNSLHINCKSVIDQLYGWIAEDELVERWLSLLPRHLILKLQYETLYCNQNLNNFDINNIYQMIDIPPYAPT